MNKKLIGVRDPHGIRPLVLGEKEGAKLVVDGRNFKLQGYENGYCVENNLIKTHMDMSLDSLSISFVIHSK